MAKPNPHHIVLLKNVEGNLGNSRVVPPALENQATRYQKKTTLWNRLRC